MKAIEIIAVNQCGQYPFGDPYEVRSAKVSVLMQIDLISLYFKLEPITCKLFKLIPIQNNTSINLSIR